MFVCILEDAHHSLFSPQNPSQQQRTILIPTAPYLFQQQQQPQGAATAVVRAPTIYQQNVTPQLPPQIVRTQQPFSQATMPGQAFPQGLASYVPNPSQPINLQLQTTQGTPLPVQMPPTQGVGATTGGIVAQQATYNPPAQPKQTQARASKAIKIINPTTGTEIDLKEKSPEVPKPSSTVTALVQTTPTFTNSTPRQQGLLPVPVSTHRPDVAKDFKQKVQFQMKSSSPAFVPGQPVVMSAPPPVSQTYYRPNAIIRDPNDKEKQQVSGPPKSLLPYPTALPQKQEPVPLKPTFQQEQLPLKPSAEVVLQESLKPTTQVLEQEPLKPSAEVVLQEPLKPTTQVLEQEPLKPTAEVVPQDPLKPTAAEEVVQQEPAPLKPIAQTVQEEPQIFKPNDVVPLVDTFDPPQPTVPQSTVTQPLPTVIKNSTGPNPIIAPPVVNGVEGMTTEPVVVGPGGVKHQVKENLEEKRSSPVIAKKEIVSMKMAQTGEPISAQPTDKDLAASRDVVPATNDQEAPETTPSESKEESNITPPTELDTVDVQTQSEIKKVHPESEHAVAMEKPAEPSAEIESQGSTNADVILEKPATQPGEH